MARHFATGVPAAEKDVWAPQELGFDLADVSSTSKLNGMPTGVDGLVYLGLKSGVDQEFKDRVERWIGHPRIWGFYIVDEPHKVPVEGIRAQSDYLRERFPNAIMYAKLTNQTATDRPSWGPYDLESTGCDLLGIGGYSVRSRFPGGYDRGLIERYVTTAVRDGIPIEKISPYMQTFGGVADWPLPTREQMDEMFADWRRLVPNPVFDTCYAWNIQPTWGTQGLSNNQMMRDATLLHFKLQAEGEKPPAGALSVKIALDGESVADVALKKGSVLSLTAS
jgi:hypothetical protein